MAQPSSLEPFFRPRSVAVVGASRRHGSIGYQIVDNLVTYKYEGVIYPVNPSAVAVHSIPAVPSLLDIPGPVDLAVIVVPKEHVPSVVEQAGEKGVQALVVITAGFAETGPGGAVREKALLDAVRRHGMRLVGPNCMGLLNTDPDVSMNATFAPTMPPPGIVSMLSQSGAMGVTILDYAAELGIGIHEFVSAGNKADVSNNDLLEHWETDKGTRVILMYIENVGNPRNFTRIARRVSREKPIIVVKSGRTAAGARAASSHTGAMASTDTATGALFAQCGVLRADTVAELFDWAMAFEALPIPEGNRVAIVTNAGGPGIIIADACEAAGLDVVTLSDETRARLEQVFPEEASVHNPVDMIASATSESYRIALDTIMSDPRVDAAIAAFVPPLGIRQVDVAEAIVGASQTHRDKPILAVLMGREGLPEGRAELREAGIPAYTFPESAARSLSALYRYRQWLERPVEEPVRFRVDVDRAVTILSQARDAGREWLDEVDALQLVAAYGVPTAATEIARSRDEALEAARRIGFPVVLKIQSRDVVHKTDVGGVKVDVRSEDELVAAYEEIVGNVTAAHGEAAVDAILVQEFVQGGRETIVGMSTDPSFGPVCMFGLGGIYVEALQDVAFAVTPVSGIDAEEMIRSIRGIRLLEGIRGEAGADLDALAETIQRLSQLVEDHEGIVELDINPLLALETGCLALDARVRLAAG
jgi:acetyl coenzyme A synthetase (ADP forming)-like protein